MRKRSADRRAERSRRPDGRPARKARSSSGQTQRGQLHEFTVTKPFCAPCRSTLQQLSDKFEIPLYEYREGVSVLSVKNLAKRLRIELRTFENLKYGPMAPGFLPMANWARFKVPLARARWFEDIINYDGRLLVQRGSLDAGSYARGQRGAIRHAWKELPGYDGPIGSGGIRSQKVLGMTLGEKPPIEKSCTAGKGLWEQVDKIRKEHKR